MQLKDIIGVNISEIRYLYNSQNQYGLQEFFAFLKLSNGIIIEMPGYPDMELKNEGNYLYDRFFTAKNPEFVCRNKIEGQKITDFYFYYFEDQIDEERKCIIELENGIYFTEQNFGPAGITTVDLHVFSKDEFESIKKELEDEYKIRSYVHNIIG